MNFSKFSLIIVFVFLSVNFCWAQEDIFREESGVSPPGLPEDAGPAGVFIKLTDFESGDCLRDLHVKLELTNVDSGEAINTLRYFRGCNITLDIPAGKWSLILLADNLSTEGKDYFSDVSFTYVNSSELILVSALMKPVGSVRGEVVDDEGRNVVNAKVKFECSSEYGVLDPVETDDYGSFRGEWLPAGSCKVSALYMDRVGSTDVVINGGQLSEVNVVLEKTTTASFFDYSPYLLFLFFIVVIVYLLFRRKRRPAAAVKDKPLEPSKGMLSLMESLSDEQRRIVEVLLESGGVLSQVDICYKTRIPKASASRYISQLEKRKIVDTTRIGRLKEVRLSDWFLSQ